MVDDRGRGSLPARAVRKLAQDPPGFFALLADRLSRHARAFSSDPVEYVTMTRERLADREELRGKRTWGGGVMPWPPCPYRADDDWEAQLHHVVGAAWPCPARADFDQLWAEAVSELEDEKGLRLGRGMFAGWGDGEPALVRAVWCLTRHLRPEKVVETGVARGMTSRFLLEALERNGSGRLWSIDLPPPLDRHLHAQIGIAVPPRLAGRWTYVHGSSQRRLRPLLAAIEPIDLFIHDSNHTARNLLFELGHAWRSLASGGFVVADDVDLNCGFHTFMGEHERNPAFVCHAEPLVPDHPRQDERGVFGVVQKSCNTG